MFYKLLTDKYFNTKWYWNWIHHLFLPYEQALFISVFWDLLKSKHQGSYLDNLRPRSNEEYRWLMNLPINPYLNILVKDLLRLTRLTSCLLESLMTILWSWVCPLVSDRLDRRRESVSALLESLSDRCWRCNRWGSWRMVSLKVLDLSPSLFESRSSPLFLSGS